MCLRDPAPARESPMRLVLGRPAGACDRVIVWEDKDSRPSSLRLRRANSPCHPPVRVPIGLDAPIPDRQVCRPTM